MNPPSDEQWDSVWLASYIRNLCWTLSTRTRCAFAAPVHIIEQYSIIGRTFVLKATRAESWLKLQRRDADWKVRMNSPMARFAFEIVAFHALQTIFFNWSRITPRSLIEVTFSSVVPLTRARVAVSATFAMVGGGPKWPSLTRKLGKLEGRAMRRSTALSEPVRIHFGHFFAQVNIEVSRGHQR